MKRKLSTENDALAGLGAPLQDLTPHDLLDPDGFFRMGHPPVMIEILPMIKGIQFDDAWQRRVEIVITAKLAAARPQDLADVDAIRKAEDAQSQTG